MWSIAITKKKNKKQCSTIWQQMELCYFEKRNMKFGFRGSIWQKPKFNNHAPTIDCICIISKYIILPQKRSKFQSMLPFKKLYFTLVQRDLQKATAVWSPNYNMHISNIVSIQKRFLKFIFYKCTWVYSNIILKCHM